LQPSVIQEFVKIDRFDGALAKNCWLEFVAGRGVLEIVIRIDDHSVLLHEVFVNENGHECGRRHSH
jgi:hypothetical protein